MSTFLEDPVSCQFWVKNIASSLFDEKYRMHLDNNPEISKFLLGFAVFREPVQQITAVAVADTQAKIQDKTVRTVIETVRRQYLLQPVGEGLYKLHPIIAAYIRDYFARNDLQALKNAHTKAEQFYMSQQRVRYAKKEKRQHTIIEAIWQQCQAEDYQGAFKLILEEQIFDNLHEWKELKSLLELLLLIDKNSLEAQQSIYIYLNQGRVYYTLGNEKQAKEYYEIVWNLSRELSDLTLRAYLLDCIGIYYYDRALYKEALAFFLLAKDLFEGMQSQNPHYTIVQEHITMLSKKTDEAQFKVLMKDLEQSKHQIAEEAINEDTG